MLAFPDWITTWSALIISSTATLFKVVAHNSDDKIDVESIPAVGKLIAVQTALGSNSMGQSPPGHLTSPTRRDHTRQSLIGEAGFLQHKGQAAGYGTQFRRDRCSRPYAPRLSHSLNKAFLQASHLWISKLCSTADIVTRGLHKVQDSKPLPVQWAITKVLPE